MTNFETQLSQSGFIVFTNKGISMMPLIHQDKDIMIIRSLENPPQKNDAVLFKRNNGQYILHRIIKIGSDGTYFIRGDNCIYGEKVQRSQILGILTEIKRGNETLKITDKKYKRYVKTVRFRWLLLVFKTKFRRMLSKLYHLIVR